MGSAMCTMPGCGPGFNVQMFLLQSPENASCHQQAAATSTKTTEESAPVAAHSTAADSVQMSAACSGTPSQATSAEARAAGTLVAAAIAAATSESAPAHAGAEMPF